MQSIIQFFLILLLLYFTNMISTLPLHIVLVSLFALMTLIQIWYYLHYYRRAAFYKSQGLPEAAGLPPVTIIICARNEARNLQSFLPSVLEQNYPSFEVVVVNDCSEDDTFNVVGLLMEKHPNLKISSIQKDPGFTHAKKLAMLIGIKAASNDLLVFTDADCQPVSDKWLRYIVSKTGEKTEIVLGYGGYMAGKGLLNHYLRYETMFIGTQYAGMAMAGSPYMGVGRNLCYSRNFFFESGGFGPFNHVLSGDDDLFVNRNATSENCRMMLDKESFTRSVPPKNFSEWVRQKQRHMTTARYYKAGDKLRLFLEPFSRVAYYGLLVALLIMLVSWPIVAGLALLRFVIRAVVIRKSCKTLDEKELWFFSLFFDILSPFVSSVLFLANTRRGKRRPSWK